MLVHDPYVLSEATAQEARHEYGLEMTPLDELQGLDALVLAVSHREYLAQGTAALCARVREGGVIFDVKCVLDRSAIPKHLRYLSL